MARTPLRGKGIVLFATGLAVVLLLSTPLLLSGSGNATKAALPEGVVPVELDESTVFLIPLDDGFLLFDTGYP